MKFTIILMGGVLGFFSAYVLNIFIEVQPKAIAISSVCLIDTFFGIANSIKNGNKFNLTRFARLGSKLFTYNLFLFVFIIMQQSFGINWIDSVIFGVILTTELLSALKNANDSGFISNVLFKKISKQIEKESDNLRDRAA